MKIAIFWHRRDLRLQDNAGLYHALKSKFPVLPLFIFDSTILDKLEDKKDRRVDFIYQAMNELKDNLEKLGSSLLVKYGNPLEVFQQLLPQYEIAEVYTNHDYEPYAKQRDNEVLQLLINQNIPFFTYKDQCIFEKNEVVKDDGKPYTVFTPYSKKWKAKLNNFYLSAYPTEKYVANLYKVAPLPFPLLQEIGFEKTGSLFPEKIIPDEIIRHYEQTRNLPAIKGTSRLSVHLRFGTISIREVAKKATALNEKWLNELIWREFYMMILWHFPHVATQAFKKKYDNIKWRNNEQEFEAWCNGQTGYPIVDAGMRELNTTGFMHNRVRMITASFLVKHLLIDWRWGEAYFAQKLLDYDLAANNGGWQWVAGSGCDAAPYFRVFSPSAQVKKFDTTFQYIRQWVPEFNEIAYPQPIVVHEEARERAIRVYKEALQ